MQSPGWYIRATKQKHTAAKWSRPLKEGKTSSTNTPLTRKNTNEVTEMVVVKGGVQKKRGHNGIAWREWVVWWQVVCMFCIHVNEQTRWLNKVSCSVILMLIYRKQSKYRTLARTTWVEYKRCSTSVLNYVLEYNAVLPMLATGRRRTTCLLVSGFCVSLQMFLTK